MAHSIRITGRIHSAEQRKPGNLLGFSDGSMKLVLPSGALVNSEVHGNRRPRASRLNKKQRRAQRRAAIGTPQI